MARLRINLLFHVTSAISVLFALTITAMVATLNAPDNHPLNVALNRYGPAALAIEILGILVFGGLAIWRDALATAPALTATSTSSPVASTESAVSAAETNGEPVPSASQR